VLLQGTGGVSIFGLQIAVAAGAKAFVTSSSDAKLQLARSLGATGLVNYNTTPDWDKAIRELTGGIGANHVLDVGGSGSLRKSIAAVSGGGHVALIGGLAGFGGDIPAVSLIGRNVSVTGIFVGSRADFEALNTFIEKHQLRPIIDRSFEFFNAELAYEHLQSGKHFGKVVIRH
jgi:NADPH:quinone reductase-like Zn-dependent oxidoreductase